MLKRRQKRVAAVAAPVANGFEPGRPRVLQLAGSTDDQMFVVEAGFEMFASGAAALSPTEALEPRRPGRPRDARADRAILEATLELAAEFGPLGLSMDAVAERAGVSKATIYRRWSSKEALLLDAWRELAGAIPVPDSGVLRDDLRVLYAGLCRNANETPTDQ